MYHSLCTHVKDCSLPKAWVSALELTFLSFSYIFQLLHITAEENKNAEKNRFMIMLYTRESASKAKCRQIIHQHCVPFLTAQMSQTPHYACRDFPEICFLLFCLTISNFTSTESYFLLICLLGAELTTQRLSAAKLSLCRLPHRAVQRAAHHSRSLPQHVNLLKVTRSWPKLSETFQQPTWSLLPLRPQ